MQRAHLDYVLALHHELTTGSDLCWSPYSVASALGLTAAGGEGSTREQLLRLLAGGHDLTALQRLLADSASLTEASAAVANSLWMDRQVTFRDDYQRQVRQMPGGALHTADFRHDPEGSRQAINADVEHSTRGLVKQLLAEGAIDSQTAAVIVNALYLKVAWLHPFAAPATTPGRFRTPAGTREVPTMRQQESFPYAEAGGWRMATLPTPSEVVVDILLPAEEITQPEQWPALTPDTLTRLQSTARGRKLDLALPKFRVEHAVTLNSALRRLGVVDAFDPDRADFTGITEDRRIFVDLVVHKAVLRADEEGFEGAAATAVAMRIVSMDLSTPTPFHVDRPFLVLVRHARTGAIYFLAQVVEP